MKTINVSDVLWPQKGMKCLFFGKILMTQVSSVAHGPFVILVLTNESKLSKMYEVN
jgi:hypothetical protein